MRASPEVRNAFAKSLPQEILSELVIVMSDLPATPKTALATHIPNNNPYLPQPNEVDEPQYQSPYGQPAPKRARKSEGNNLVVNGDGVYEVKTVKKAARKPEPPRKIHTLKFTKPLPPTPSNNRQLMHPDRELAYCRDLITRMLSGPGFWTRLVGPFKEPVDPVRDKAPKYFDVVKRPMDLKTIKAKMDQNEYPTAAEFEADVRLIFQNCYEYWTPDDRVFRDCEAFESYFNDKWSNRYKCE